MKDIEVVYGHAFSTDRHTLPQDINKGYQGSYVYLKPIFTTNRNEAATKFKLKIGIFSLPHRDLAKGAGGAYRYLLPVNDIAVNKKITRIWLSENQEGDGYTSDINKNRGGRFLYLNWNLD